MWIILSKIYLIFALTQQYNVLFYIEKVILKEIVEYNLSNLQYNQHNRYLELTAEYRKN